MSRPGAAQVQYRRIFVGAVAISGLTAAALSIQGLLTEPVPVVCLILAALVCLSIPLSIRAPGIRMTVSITETLSFVVLLAFGAAPAVATVALEGLITALRRRKIELELILFNTAEPALSMAVAALVLDTLSGLPAAGRLGAPIGQLALPCLAAATVLEVSNTILNAVAVALDTGVRFRTIFREYASWVAPNFLGWMSLALILVHSAGDSGAMGVLAVAPLVVGAYVAVHSAIRLTDEARRHESVQVATIEALTLAIEARDSTTREEMESLAVYATGLARHLGMDEGDVQAVRTSALLHDIGNLAVPEYILSKPGPLTAEEFRRVQIHPKTGAEIIQAVPFSRPVAPLVLTHHEHWDGSGYPLGLAGEKIPAGARVLAVADTFTSLMTDRPYRPARSFDDAVAALLSQGGTVLDPVFTRAFVDTLPALVEARAAARWTDRRTDPIRAPHGPDNPLDDIAGAHREARRLFDQVREASLTDELTGLPNRRALETHLARELDPTREGRLPTAVLLLDLDGLKAFNDSFGHHTGDRAIREVASALSGQLRRYDLCARYAGDEFVVVLSNCTAEAAALRAATLQDAVAGVGLTVEPGLVVRLSISAGVAVSPADGTTQNALIAVADERMYHDKQARKRASLERSALLGRTG